MTNLQHAHFSTKKFERNLIFVSNEKIFQFIFQSTIGIRSVRGITIAPVWFIRKLVKRDLHSL